MDRLNNPLMEYYHHTYANSKMWDGTAEQTVIVYAEQGFGDIIQFSRCIPQLKRVCSKVYFHCPKELHRLFACLDVELLDKDDPELPPHDSHILSLELPFVLPQEATPSPYLTIAEVEDLSAFTDKIKIGIAWESGALSNNSSTRNCPVVHFGVLQTEKTVLFSLQKEIKDLSLLCDMNLYGAELSDFYDTAKLINALDFVVSVDTAVLHLSGAMGKKTFGIFNKEHDPRWDLGNWYPITCVKANKPNDWGVVLKSVKGLCGV